MFKALVVLAVFATVVLAVLGILYLRERRVGWKGGPRTGDES